jgi:hypothetical protein
VSQTLAPGTHTIVGAQCPDSKKVLGGGFSIEFPPDIYLYSSLPEDPSHPGSFTDVWWSAEVENIGTLSRQVAVIAICATVQ